MTKLVSSARWPTNPAQSPQSAGSAGPAGGGAAVRTGGDADQAGRPGFAVDDVDDADERRGPIHDRRRAAHDFNAVDVGQIEGGEIGIECAAPGYAVHDQKKGIKLFEAPKLRDRARRSCVTA